ncbi:MAG: hypothetical protein V1689_14875 [Pseudomonadota bacterium]
MTSRIPSKEAQETTPKDNRPFRPGLALITLGYWLATCLLHLEISKIIIAPMPTPLGILTLSEYSSAVGRVVLLGMAVFIAFQVKNGQSRGRTLSYWSLWLTAVYFANKTLVVTPSEYIHYPQYAILAILMVFCLDRQRTLFPFWRLLFWATFMGILDEMNQHFFLCPSYGEYLDFNDFFLNELGAVAGLLLAYGFRKFPPNAGRPMRVHKTAEFKLVTACLAILLILHMSGRLRITPPTEIPPGGIVEEYGKKVVWSFLMLLMSSIFITFDPQIFRRLAIKPSPAKRFDT